jgi:hypothetical protein
MSSYPPPAPPSHLPPAATGHQPGTPAPDGQGESRACPVCMGSGEVPASMGRDEMLQALDSNMSNPENPESGELSQDSTSQPFAHLRKDPLSPDQQAEVSRLGTRARGRMSGAPHLGS